jgi:signal peptidase I
MRRIYKWMRRPGRTVFEEYLEAFIVILPIAFLIRTFGFGLYQVPTCSMESTMLVGESFFADKFTPLITDIKRGDIIAFNDPNYNYPTNKLANLFRTYIWGPVNFTKRVIGVPGDHIQGVIEEGKPVIYLNDKKLNEPYVNPYPIVTVIKENIKLNYRNSRDGNIITNKTFDPNKHWDNQPFYRISKKNVLPVIAYPGTPLPNKEDIFDVKLGAKEYWAMGDNRLGSSDSRVWGILNRKNIHGKILFRIFSVDSDENWLIMDLIKHPIDFWKRVRWSRFLQPVK